jgi:hypothetical protein
MNRWKIGLGVFAVLGLLLWSSVRPSASVQPSFQFNPPKPWRKVSMPGTDGAWVLNGDPARPSLTVALEAGMGSDEFDQRDFNENKMVDALTIARAFPYRIYGIHDWKVERHHVSRLPHGFYIEMIGSYQSPSEVTVRFVERDYFIGTSSYGVTYSEDSTAEKKIDVSRTEELLNGFRPDGGGV